MLSERQERPELRDKRDITVGDYYRLLMTIKFLRLMPKFGLAEHKLDDLIERAIASPWLYGNGRVEDFDAESFLNHLRHDESAQHIMERDMPEPPKAPEFKMPSAAEFERMSPMEKLRLGNQLEEQKRQNRKPQSE